MQTKTKHLWIAVAIFAAEILIATVFSNLNFVRSYLGDFLVVMLLYHLVKVFRDVPPLALAALVFIFACCIEIAQYFHLADVLGLRRGSLGSTLIGTSFSWGDILAYFLGSLTSCLADSYFFFKAKGNAPNS
ncbi:MAG: DUF2809 domain-containing protein [Anaerolineae bacterium]|nr:DUF2809 domain-containing protein [Anaerolineae bacterium]